MAFSVHIIQMFLNLFGQGFFKSSRTGFGLKYVGRIGSYRAGLIPKEKTKKIHTNVSNRGSSLLCTYDGEVYKLILKKKTGKLIAIAIC